LITCNFTFHLPCDTPESLYFCRLFNYIQGKNAYNETIEMTAPVITQVSPSDGPFCASSFVVSFYVPKKNQADPPPADGLHLQKWGPTFAAVRQFSGFVSDDTLGEEAAALYLSLQGSNWSSAVDQGRKADPTSAYTVAQYNSPFEFSGRVNEIWMLFSQENKNTM
jgi:SOUL heme-binding protein